MSVNIAYYVHHHGSGHVMRAISICRALADYNITFLGSNLEGYMTLMPPNVKCIHLPMDTAAERDKHHLPHNPVGSLHYAPLNVTGLRERIGMITEFFNAHYPLLLIVDVSVEVTLLARLCGVPTIVMRQHGDRYDQAHLAAYQSASALMAPYPDVMQRREAKWLTEKTIYTGGFSRYHGFMEDEKPGQDLTVAVLTGSGGTSIDLQFISHLAYSCKNWHFVVIGLRTPEISGMPDNITFHGRVRDPFELLTSAKIVIGNAGHNTVMEMGSLNKRFIAIPEDRPFNEQLEKALLLQELGLATVVEPKAFYHTDWPILLSETAQSLPNWTGIIVPDAIQRAADGILSVYKSLFN
ncbi:hypothetical protein INP83_11310 [Mucilaginibacter sp. 21P]|uniref:glycosyltransferase n=1 Tax=Mucilaginibacter sp. 21P TaxID=2778902 RepID=UPI001C57E253|nr:glycosyltransferase [Mucilaginibacter sp. 21P]QXV63699.1 hypothetical protein INP83_11310 [Mucilaginibacter sp. 21P]